MHTREEKVAAFGRLLDIMDLLREKCPWNAAQTIDTIRPMTEEEVYELSDTILKGDRKGTAKEIGDLLYHMVFYARIAQEEGSFDIADSLNKVCDKMVFRHPHVFGPEAGKPTTAKEIADTWELVKAKEKDGNKRVMSGIPDAMPAILKAMSLQEKGRGCGFDWEQKEDVWPKVQEELGEAEEACAEADPKHMQEEFGDLLFAVINASRLYGIDPEAALNGACAKFRRRFNYMEEETIRRGLRLADMTRAEMDAMHTLRVPGPTLMRVMRGYLSRYVPEYRETSGREEALTAAEESEAGIFRYREGDTPHFICYLRQDDGQFRFFNVDDNIDDGVMSMQKFGREHFLRGNVIALTIPRIRRLAAQRRADREEDAA